MTLIRVYLSQLVKIILSKHISSADKVRFVIFYSVDLAKVLLSRNSEKTTIFIDGRHFSYLGNHINLPLNHLINHLDDYYYLYKNATTIVDVGASFGTFPRIVNYFVPKCKIYSVEMVEESFDMLQKNCAGLKNVDVTRVAIGIDLGTVNYSFDPEYPEGGNINLVNYSKSGSVKQTTLDKFVEAKKIKHISLLKIDAEGYESKILKASSKALKKTDTVVVETQFEIGNLTEVLSLMDSSDFYLDRFGALNINLSDGSIGSADLVFKKGKHHI
jgi:FkbM family methyltransferase